MTRSVEIVRADQIDDDVVELGSAAFGKPRRAYRQYLEWKYLQNPYLGDPLLYVAREADGAAVAMRGFYGARWSTPAGLLDMPCADDFAVATHHRTSGIATELMRHAHADLADQGVRYVVNASGGKVTVLQSLAMGWKSVVAVDPLDRKLGDDKGGKVLRYLRSKKQALPRTERSLEVAEDATTTPDADAMEVVAARTYRDDVVRHVRDAAFYRWRYANPSREYRFLLASSEDRVTGYIAVGRQRPKPETLPLYIADWEGESAEVRARLLQRAVKLCGSATMRIWAASSSAEDRALLDKMGFEPAQPELRAHGMPCILFRSLAPINPQVVAAIVDSTWDIRVIDSMHG